MSNPKCNESDVDSLSEARALAKPYASPAGQGVASVLRVHNITLWTMARQWTDAASFHGAIVRGSAWRGGKYLEVKSGVLFEGELES